MQRIPVPAVVRTFLRNEERASTVVIGGSALVVVACFAAAVLAMALMK